MTDRNKMLAVIICGSRVFDDRELISKVVFKMPFPDFVITGGASGADALGESLAAALRRHRVVMRAQWDTYGRKAGPIRNDAMLDVLNALRGCGWETMVYAFPLGKSPGTRGMIRLAGMADIPCTVTEQSPTKGKTA